MDLVCQIASCLLMRRKTLISNRLPGKPILLGQTWRLVDTHHVVWSLRDHCMYNGKGVSVPRFSSYIVHTVQHAIVSERMQPL